MIKKLTLVIVGLLLLSSCTLPIKDNDPVKEPTTPRVEQPAKDTNNKDTLYNQFAKKLEAETLKNELNWDTVFQITHEFESNRFNYILESNEFHTMYDLKSYGIAKEDGLSIFILNEQFESGKDGMLSNEINLYLVEGTSDNSFQVPVSNDILLELEEKVRFYVDSKYIDNSEFDGLIKDYINKE